MFLSKLFSWIGQPVLGLLFLGVGGWLLADVWIQALGRVAFAPEQGVYPPLCVLVGVALLFRWVDLAERLAAAEVERRQWFWQWSWAAWGQAAGGCLVGFGHLALLNWVAG